MEALEIIRQSYKDFSRTNKKIADNVMRNPDMILSQTASEIAKGCNASAASVIRFTKLLGFSGLEEFKISIATAIKTSENQRIIDPIIKSDDSISDLIDKVEILINSTMTDLKNLINEIDIKQAISQIKQAENIYMLGIGASSLTAYNLYHKFNRAGEKAFYNFDAHMNLEFINYSTEKDVVIAISYSGKTREVILPCKKAKENGSKIIFITSNNSQVIKELADIVILVPDNEHVVRIGAISSVTSSMAIGDILYLGAIQEDMDTHIPERMIATNELINQLKKE